MVVTAGTYGCSARYAAANDANRCGQSRKRNQELIVSTSSAATNSGKEIARSAPRGSVLVVDDDEDQQQLLNAFLTQAGYGVQLAGSAEEAFAALASRAGALPDVVILDVLMPGINGFEACRRIRSDVRMLDLPVVLVTALNSREERVTGIQAGADDFLSKPVSREELLARVNSLVRLTQARKALEHERLAAEAAKTERMRSTFERYMAPKLVEQILSTPEAGSGFLKARRLDDVCALFADLRGFTRMCAKLEVEAAVDILNSFFSQLVETSRVYEGTTFGMAGDSLLVGFNVPLRQKDATRRAVLSAVDMLLTVQPLVQTWRERYSIDVGVGIGINIGSAIVGDVGAPNHRAYTMIGDAVNVAARLMQIASAGEILMTGDVARTVPDLLHAFNAEQMNPVDLKGKDQPVAYFRVTREACAAREMARMSDTGRLVISMAGAK
jgi:adenylate cyclase